MGNSEQGSFYDKTQNFLDKLSQTIPNPYIIRDSADLTSQALFAKFDLKGAKRLGSLGEVLRLRHKQSGEQVMLKVVQAESLQESKQVQKRWNKLLSHTCQHIQQVKCIDITITLHKKSPGFLSDSFKVLLFVDDIITDLGSELKRRRARKSPPSQVELRCFFNDLIDGSVYLQKQNYDPNYLRLDTFFIGMQQGKQVGKVMHPELMQLQSNLKLFQNKETQIYIAPQQFQSLSKGQLDNEHRRASSFVLAYNILQLGLLTPSLFVQGKPQFEQLNEQLILFRQNYSTEFYLIIRDMLQVNWRSRATLREFHERALKQLKVESRPPLISICNVKDQKQEKEFQTRTALNHSLRPDFAPQENRSSQNRPSQTATLMNGLSKVYSGSKAKGKATDVYKSGATFIGQKKNDRKNGRGKFVFPDGSSFEGQWVDDKMTGAGVLSNKYKQVVYEGQFLQNKFQGSGIFYNLQVQQVPTDHRNLTFSNWLSYEGDFKSGLKSGQGVMLFWDSGKFVGQFRQDLPHGVGTFKYKSGEQRRGRWKGGMIQE